MAKPVPTVGEILKYVATLRKVVGGSYASDQGLPATLNILDGSGKAYVWTADADIDSDGLQADGTPNPRSLTDPWFQPQTSFQFDGKHYDPERHSFFVIPLPSGRFDYQAAGIKPGAVGGVIYNGTLRYGVFADEGPSDIIGELSMHLAGRLGINSDPRFGGTDGPVSYVVFKGDRAVPKQPTSQAEIDRLGTTLMSDLVPTGPKVPGRTLIGTQSRDVLSGGSGDDRLQGEAGPDSLSGKTGNDRLSGGDGNDRLLGGAGRDTLLGGLGRDTFVFASAADTPPGTARRDSIVDFAREDVLDLSRIDADSLSAGSQDFHFIGAAAFTGAAGQLHYRHTTSGGSSRTIVEGDLDGNLSADFQISLAGFIRLTHANLLGEL